LGSIHKICLVYDDVYNIILYIIMYSTVYVNIVNVISNHEKIGSEYSWTLWENMPLNITTLKSVLIVRDEWRII
jgi:hypothetical protein